MKAINDITALILAAGESSRMGTIKPLLPAGEDTVIERIIALFRSAGIENILVVLGHQADRLTPVLDRRGVSRVINADYHHGMFSSIQTGIRALGKECRAVFIHPGDMPLVRPETIRTLVDALTDGPSVPDALENAEALIPDDSIYHPCYQGRRGHPPLIPKALIPAILAFQEPGGLRALLGRFSNQAIDVACDDPGILVDLNTPEDYGRHFGSSIPGL